jgi:hypothetical protein
MLNTQLQDQLRKAIKDGKINPKYPDGYRDWKAKFDYWFNITHDVLETLRVIHGEQGDGSIYKNSNLDIKAAIKPNIKMNPKMHSKSIHNNTFNILRLKEK